MKATEVTAGLAESNGGLLPSLWRDSLHVTCGLTACTPGSAPGPTLGNECGKTLPLCVADVLALAGALCMLGAGLRAVRTALWCALQLTCADLPVPCVRRARQAAARHLALTSHHGRGGKSHAAASAAAAESWWDHGDDAFSDGDEIPEEDETHDE